MRVVTFNIHHGTRGSGPRVDVDRLVEVCVGFDADVLALQEVDLNMVRSGRVDLAGAVARATGMELAFCPSLKRMGGWYGNALLVRGSIDHWSLHRLPRVPAWQKGQEQRTALLASVRVGGVALAVVATHLAVVRRIGLVQLRAVADLAAAEPEPVVVVGDLNREPHEVGPEFARVGLEVVAHGPTHPVCRPRHTIDHVVHSPDLAVTSLEVRRTKISDHRALLVDLELAPER